MAQASQEFPPWLTLVEETITDANGSPVETQTSVLYLPLTYYGPSIPLDSDWTYGGLSSPAPTPQSTTSATPTTISATPTSSETSTTSETSIPTSTTSISSTLPSQTAETSSSNSPVPSSTLAPSSAASQKGKNLAIVLSSVFGALLLAFILLVVCLFLRRRRRRAEGQVSFMNPLEGGYHNVNGDNDSNDSAISRVPVGRQAGEGSPRVSGEERDSFLRMSGSRRVPVPDMTELGGRRPLSTGSAMVASQSSGSTLQTTSSGTNSGFGQVVPSTLRTTPLTDEERGLAPIGVALSTVPAALAAHHELQQRSGQIMTVRDLNRIGEEDSVESEGHAIVHPPLHYQQTSTPPRESSPSSGYSPLVPPQRIDPDYGYTPRPKVRESNSSSQRSSFPTDAEEDATFLTATRVQVGELGPRLSNLPESPSGPSAWFAGLNWFKPSDSNSNPDSRRQSYIDQVLADDGIESALLRPSRGSPLDRPISSISTGSGGSVYHDAPSTLNSRSQISVPLPSPSSLAPLPRAFGSNDSGTRSHSNNPYDALLDQPAPLPFSGTGPRPSSRAGAASAVNWLKMPTVRPLNNPFMTPPERPNPHITIDLLEEAPPTALTNWTSIAGGIQVDSPRNTFGLPGITNREEEHDSLRSMRSGHLSPSGSRGSRSAGSASSRGHALFGSEGSHSAHSGGSRGPGSPALSAFGPNASLIRSPITPLRNPPPQTPLAAGPSGSSLAPTMNTHDTKTTATTHLTGSTVGGTSEPPTSPKSSVFKSPWIHGLENEWVPT